VGFPEDELTSNEHVVMHLHPHWKQVAGPFAVLVIAVAAVITAWAVNLGGVGIIVVAAVALVLVVWLTLIPLIKWRTAHYVITNERVITRVGVFSQHTENIPIDRVSDVQFDQSLFQRILGCGKLSLASPGEHGPDVLNNIPNIKHVVVTLNELIRPDAAAPPAPVRSSHDGTTEHLKADK